MNVLGSIRIRLQVSGHFLIPVTMSEESGEIAFCMVKGSEGKSWLAVYTSPSECEKEERSQVLSNPIEIMLQMAIEEDLPGYIVNPWGESFSLTIDRIRILHAVDGERDACEK